MKKKKRELSDLSSRFLLAIEIVGYTGNRLIKETDHISHPILTHIKSGRNDPSTKIITEFLKKFPTINARWLITGEGKPEYDVTGINEAVKAMDYTRILHRVPFEEVLKYLHRYQDMRKWDTNNIFKGFLDGYIQDEIRKGLEAIEAKVDRLEKSGGK